MTKIFTLTLVFVIVFLAAAPAAAQGPAPYVIRSTKPISQELREQLDAWLATDPPSAAPYYIVTYAKPKGTDLFVSLVGVDLPSPESDWDLEEGGDAIVWMGSVIVAPDGSVTPFLPEQVTSNTFKAFAMFSPAPGGGSYVSFPFQAGTAMIYGPRAVHGSGDYGTSGMLAVDLVSGDDYGADAAPPQIYASDAGVIDYVCDDGTSVAVRTHNSTTNDYFVYAHLLDNENLAISSSFDAGELIGTLKYGSFDDSCGWAEQQPDHYHIHWMFKPNNGSFQAEDCVLSTSSQKWDCGGETIGTGGWLKGGGGYGVGIDDTTGSAGSTVAEKSFWDYMIIGFVTLFDRGLIKLLPEHTSPALALTIVFNGIKLTLKTAWVLMRFNVNLGPLMACLAFAIGFRIITGIVFLVGAVLRTIKILPFA